ncbi:polyphenol oxidase family protein [Synergistaceae bacterium OttesenSCG-928-D05]|nr:polyphenol oxidase family protein [Synergistaceae bacterium OttesenSCG-928-D05]
MTNDSAFSLSNENGLVVLNFNLPEALRDIFSVKLFGRGAAMDAAQGNPEKSWLAVKTPELPDVKLIAPYQVHGTAVLPAHEIYAWPTRPQADGIFLTQAAKACGSLRFADCTPVIIAGTKPRPWMLLLHSGYVGTVKDISGTALAREIERGTIDLSGETWAWIAPSICPKCYSRKKDGDLSTTNGLAVFDRANYEDKGSLVFFDIQSQIALQLERAGLAKNRIFTMRRCTHCEHGFFYSYRGGDLLSRNFLLACATKASL